MVECGRYDTSAEPAGREEFGGLLGQFCTVFSMISMCLSESCNDGTDHSLLIILSYQLLNLYFKVTAASAARKEMKCCQEKVFKQP